MSVLTPIMAPVAPLSLDHFPLAAALVAPPALANQDYSIQSRPGSEEGALFDNIPGTLGSPSGREDETRSALGPLLKGENGVAVQNCARKVSRGSVNYGLVQGHAPRLYISLCCAFCRLKVAVESSCLDARL